MGKSVVIVGGHGNVALRLTKLLIPTHSVTSIIRSPEQGQAIKNSCAKPLLLSLEDAHASDFSNAFKGCDIVYFCAGAGANVREERTKGVDFEGAVKVFDAIEGIPGPKPRLILVSAMDVRSPDEIPEYYNENDIVLSRGIRAIAASYMHWKYEAEKELVKRTLFKWTIVRPGRLTDEPGKGSASIGREHLGKTISRDDVAKALSLLIDREDAAGLAIDVTGGNISIEKGLDAAIERGETGYLG